MTKSKTNGPPSLTLMRTLAKEAVFNPRKPGPMSIVADVDSPEYLTRRAMEELSIALALQKLLKPETLKKETGVRLQYSAHLNKAIQLLLLARARTQ